MSDLELIFSMLGERATTEITQVNNSKGFEKFRRNLKSNPYIRLQYRILETPRTGFEVLCKR